MCCDRSISRPQAGIQQPRQFPNRPNSSFGDAGPPHGKSRSIRVALRRGFSLVELMVVIVIIGLLAGVITVSVRSFLIRSKQNVARLEIAKICQALDTLLWRIPLLSDQ